LQSPRKLQIAIVGLGAHVATIFPNLHPKSNLVCIHKWSSKVDIINNIIIHLIIYTTSTMFIPKIRCHPPEILNFDFRKLN
jgi:hypothetical protein